MSIELIHGDCMDVMATYQYKYFYLAVVDPPYGIGVNVNMGRRKGDKKSTYHAFYGGDKQIPNREYFNELFRISENQIIWGGNYMTEFLYPSPCWLMWDKGFSDEVTFAQFELAWTSFSITTKKIDFNAAANKNRIHPTQKPEYLYDWIYNKFTATGQKILDTHLGSGSSAIAAHKHGLDFVGIEIDKDYYDAAVKRFNLVTSQTTLF